MRMVRTMMNGGWLGRRDVVLSRRSWSQTERIIQLSSHGRDGGTRTRGLLVPNQALYQLSYVPDRRILRKDSLEG